MEIFLELETPERSRLQGLGVWMQWYWIELDIRGCWIDISDGINVRVGFGIEKDDRE